MLLVKSYNDAFEFVKVMYKILLVFFFPDTVYHLHASSTFSECQHVLTA